MRPVLQTQSFSLRGFFAIFPVKYDAAADAPIRRTYRVVGGRRPTPSLPRGSPRGRLVATARVGSLYPPPELEGG